jgi:hypothetical protein
MGEFLGSFCPYFHANVVTNVHVSNNSTYRIFHETIVFEFDYNLKVMLLGFKYLVNFFFVWRTITCWQKSNCIAQGYFLAWLYDFPHGLGGMDG